MISIASSPHPVAGYEEMPECVAVEEAVEHLLKAEDPSQPVPVPLSIRGMRCVLGAIDYLGEFHPLSNEALVLGQRDEKPDVQLRNLRYWAYLLATKRAIKLAEKWFPLANLSPFCLNAEQSTVLVRALRAEHLRLELSEQHNRDNKPLIERLTAEVFGLAKWLQTEVLSNFPSGPNGVLEDARDNNHALWKRNPWLQLIKWLAANPPSDLEVA